MRISLNWLNDYINLKAYMPTEISQTLTSLGIEVESIETFKTYSGPVVVGEVVECEKHPDSDHLSICKVKHIDDKISQIVCGAKNVKKGLKVAVALPGAALPNGIKINTGKIRGTASEGMLCSDDELGFGIGTDGIKELDAKAPVGKDVAEYLQLHDTVFEISLTPNRADCLGYVGIARDLAAKLQTALTEPPLKGQTTDKISSAKTTGVTVQNKDACARFSALYVQGLKALPSPMWLQRRLLAAGQRPINVIVDVTNYVMLESGQPIHAYDLRSIKGGKIAVRFAKDGEKLKTLDGAERVLRAEDIVICDATGPIGLAGIMGGENSEIREDTTDVVIEVACFDPRQVRRTSKHFGLHTDASHRFERGVNVDNIANVNERVAFLLQKASQDVGNNDVQIAADMIDSYPLKSKPKPIALRVSRLRKMLSIPALNVEKIKEHLNRLGLKLLDSTDDRLLFEVPTWRLDLEREIDLIEEVARLEGYERIPSQMPMLNIEPSYENPLIAFTDSARVSLARCGMHEVIHYSFIAAKDFDLLMIPDGHILRAHVDLANGLSDELNTMQTTLAANLLKAVMQNRRRGVRGSRLFETGRAYFDQNHKNMKAKPPSYWQSYISDKSRLMTHQAADEKRPIERPILAGILDQPRQGKSWQSEESSLNFYDGKAVVTNWLKSFGLSQSCRFEALETQSVPFLNPTAAATIFVGSTAIGYLGELHPAVSRNFEFGVGDGPVYFEIDLQRLFAKVEEPKTFVSELSKFPATLRDLSFVVRSNITHQNILDAVDKFPERSLLKSFQLFDLYSGNPIPEGSKSLSYSVAFQSISKTLNDKEVDKELDGLLKWLNHSVGAELRV